MEENTKEKVERAFVVALERIGADTEETVELLVELEALCATLGVTVVDRLTARLRQPTSRYLVGKGRAEQIVAGARASGADVIVFDDALTPSQQRNWEQLSGLAVIDRQEVILDIFGARAETREAVLQVALAQAEYDLPRLKRRWLHLSRQRGMRGGMGLRGEGEQQIEVDARLVKRRIARLKHGLDEVRKQRQVQRSRRLKRPVPVAAIVGYTNAGKSSLLNALTHADAFTEDKLFATLDPTTRRIVLPNRQELLLTDTVGFIRKLPHLLIEAFNATLEEALTADFLVEVIDATGAPHLIEAHRRTTAQVLRELGAAGVPSILVFNKTDLLTDRFTERRLRRRYPDAVLVSVKSGAGLEELVGALGAELDRGMQRLDLRIPHDRYDVIAQLHRTSNVFAERHEADGVHITAAVPRDLVASLRLFCK